ncbi:VCBS repeat-containing protein [candidate division KSB1 bacterium]|nr:VCBS repeat-containing protein [candidate division KSB1 bacterium]
MRKSLSEIAPRLMGWLISGGAIFFLPPSVQPVPLTGVAGITLTLPPFNSGSRIQASGRDLQVEFAAVPCLVDWNDDGKNDLLVGCYLNGNVYLYLNSGTNVNPSFTTRTKVQADGTDLSVGFG